MEKNAIKEQIHQLKLELIKAKDADVKLSEQVETKKHELAAKFIKLLQNFSNVQANDEKNRNDKIKCLTCHSKYTRVNRRKHENTAKHQAAYELKLSKVIASF